MEIFDYFDKFSFSELHRVSENPGVYCWYARFKIGKHDWSSMNGSEYANLLHRLLKRSRPAPMEASVKSSFGLNWNEVLTERSFNHWGSKISDLCISTQDEDGNEEEIDISSLLDSAKDRELISCVINEVEPIFSAPLYVGKANSLRSRLNQHKEKIDFIYEARPSNDEELFINGKEFYQRVYGAGFHVDDLVVYTLDLKKVADKKEINIDLSELRKHAALIEYILNRKIRPVLGRM